MQLNLAAFDDTKLITKAPLDINVNDKGTAFGGSLSSMTIISAWCMSYLLAQKFNLDTKNIVVSQNETKFKRPVTKELVCHTFMPTHDELEQLKHRVATKGRGSITLYAHIIEDEKVCVEFEGTYVLKAD